MPSIKIRTLTASAMTVACIALAPVPLQGAPGEENTDGPGPVAQRDPHWCCG